MRAVIQRVSEASVTVNNSVAGSIQAGMLVLLGVEEGDTNEELAWLSTKIIHLRIFNDLAGIMNLDLKQSGGELLLVSQFTLHASTRKGNRPSYIKAARPEIAVTVYQKMIDRLESDLGKKIATGIFGADMKVRLLNDGPVTIIIDSRLKE
ncbi:MAG: D-tyrosyl-tRNA(Tyr) deacylase [Chitinophagaceae bacterium]|nr:D-tyrosyl-tRNA(Tyr) deacylase [Chitinophagaceae bacterium]